MADPQTPQNPTAKRFVCNHDSSSCQKRFKRKGDLDRHITACHGVNILICPWCKYPNARSYRMWEHMEQVHPRNFKDSPESTPSQKFQADEISDRTKAKSRLSAPTYQVAQTLSSSDSFSNHSGFHAFNSFPSPQSLLEQSHRYPQGNANSRVIDPSPYNGVPVRNSSDDQFARNTYSQPAVPANIYQLSNSPRQYHLPGGTAGIADAFPACSYPLSLSGSNETQASNFVPSTDPYSASTFPGGFTGSYASMSSVPSNASQVDSFNNPYETANAHGLAPPMPSSNYVSPSDYYRLLPVSETPGHSYPGFQNGMYNSESGRSDYMGSIPMHQRHPPQNAYYNSFASPPPGSEALPTATLSNARSYQPTISYRPIVTRPSLDFISSLDNDDLPFISDDEPEARQ